MKILSFIFLSLFLSFLNLNGQEWIDILQSDVDSLGQIDIVPNNFDLYKIDDTSIKDILWSSPFEGEINMRDSKTIVSFPIGGGNFEDFKVVEYIMMDQGLSSKYSYLKTFKGVSTTNPYRHVRIDHTLYGLRAVVKDEQNTIYIDHYQRNDLNTRMVYNKKDFNSQEPWECGVNSANIRHEDGNQRSVVGDCKFREYRLALACTGEYAAFHGGTIPLVMSAFVTSINRVNLVYEYDNAVRLNLISNNDLLIYLDANTDPYTNNNGGTMLGQNITTCNNVIGNGNYDIGHVFSTGGGGVAYLGCVCNNNNKAGGVTGLSSPIGDPFDIDYVAHEMGHQFGGNHTQNNSCNRNNNTAMEPGSASTIMGYAGICSPNVQNNSDDYFHAVNLTEIMNEMQSNGHTCEIDTMSFNNAPPVVIDQSDYSIPKSTNFFLKVTASDPDNDPLEYLWDQMDNQVATMPPASTNTGGPTFRSIKFTSSPYRYFPSIDNIINNTNDIWEVLPSVSRTLNFRGTAKDYHNIGGCNDEENVVVTIVGSAGPFIVTSQNTSVTWDAFTSQIITWEVANTDTAPISAVNVDIILSVDGGLTYLDTIAANVPNDGSHTITVPNNLTSMGRIMVKASGNVFFDINDADINIEQNFPFYSLNLVDNPFDVCASTDSTMNQIMGTPFGGFTGNVDLSVIDNNSGATFSIAPNPLPVGTMGTLTASNYGSLIGDFPMKIAGISGTLTDTLDIVFRVFDPSGIPILLTPIDGIGNVPTSPSFTWAPDTNAIDYVIEVSQSSNFSNLEINEIVNTNAYSSTINLVPYTVYFWRVKSSNSCGASSYSNTFNFITNSCITFPSSDVPKPISSSGTPTVNSELIISQQLSILDVNVLDINGSHTNVSNLTFSLIGPDLTTTVLMNQVCGNVDNFDINFDDEAASSTIPCPPTTGLKYKPANPLSVYDTKDALGTWKLKIDDSFNNDGGSLNAWSLEVCTVQPCSNKVSNNNSSGPGSLNNALSCVAPGDTILFESTVVNDTIDLGSNILTFSSNLTLLSPYGAVNLSSTSNQDMINIDLSVNVFMDGLNLISTSSSGRVIECNGNLTLKDCKIYKPKINNGDAIRLLRGANLFIAGDTENIEY